MNTAAALQIALPAMTRDHAAGQIVAAAEAAGGALRLGFGREIPAGQFPASHALPWQRTDDGRHMLKLDLSAPGAQGLRIALRPKGLPDAATLAFSGPATDSPHTLHGALINASLAADAAAGSEAPLFWSPLIVGDALAMRITLPADADPGQVRLTLPLVSHLDRLPGESPVNTGGNDLPAATDPACHPDWNNPSRATAVLLYTHSDGATGTCSGTLVADADPETDIPYILTAQHCFPDQVRASSIDSHWLLRAETCGGPVGTGIRVPGGADVLYLHQSTDTALLRLRQAPPRRAAFVNVTPALPAIGTETVGIHHPFAGPQRLSRAAVGEYKTCIEVDWCGEDADPEAIGYVRVERRIGGTQPGSSGSGLFNREHRLIGTHLGGSDEGGFEYYGRLDAPYHNALMRWLGSGADGSLPAKP